MSGDDVTKTVHAPASANPPLPEEITVTRLAGNGSELAALVALTKRLDPIQVAIAIRADQRRRWRIGERIPLEAYLANRPELARERSVLLDLVYNEYLLAEEGGASIPPANLAGRFPEIADDLVQQIELHRLLDAAGEQHATVTPDSSDPKRSHKSLPAIPGYQLLDELGRGGMGVVYRAHQVQLNRVVAIKTLLDPERAEAADVVRFLAEAEAIAAVKHLHVVPVFEFGQYLGRPYFAMEHLAGGSLRDRLDATNTIGPMASAALMAKVARGVQAAHDQQVIHRDLKPANILFDEHGEPKVTDFGLARRGAGAGLTQTQAVMGTPAYMAPEQAEGKGKFVGPGADVYALGVILYECLTGSVPFHGDDPLTVLRRVVQDDPEPPRKRNPGIPRDIEIVCMKCLQKGPADRYASAGELGADLERFAAGIPVSVRAPGRFERWLRWTKRNPREAALLGLAAGLLLALTVGASIAAVWMRKERDIAQANETRALKAEGAATDRAADLAVAEDGLRQELIRSNRSVTGEVRAMRLRGDPGRYFSGIAKLREALARARRLGAPAEDIHRIRDEMMNLFTVTDVDIEHQWNVPSIAAMAFNPTLDRYVSFGADGPVCVRESPGGRVVGSFPDNVAAPSSVEFSSDGKRILLWHQNQNRASCWRLNGERVERLFEATARRATFLTDGRVAIDAVADETRLDVLNADSGTVERSIPNVQLVWGKQAHQSKPWLAVARQGRIVVVNHDTGDTVATTEFSSNDAWLAWHPTRPILAVPDKLQIRLWNVTTGRETTSPLEGHAQAGILVGFNPTGELLISNDWSGVLRCWDTGTGRHLLSMPKAWPSRQITFAQSEDRLAAGHDELRLQTFRLHLGRGLRALARSDVTKDGLMGYFNCSPDGRLLVGQVGDRGTAFFNPSTLEEQPILPDAWRAIRFLNDGSLMTNGPRGPMRWPVRHEQGRCRVGPPSRLATNNTHAVWGADAEGRILTEPRFNFGAGIFHADTRRWIQTPPQVDVRFSDVSSDSRWLAAGSHVSGSVKVYATDTGKEVAHLQSIGGIPRFSPDSRTLGIVASFGGVRVFDCESWRKRWEGPGGGLAFSPDSGLIAIGEGYGAVQIRATADGRPIARLEVPEHTRLVPECFGPAGGSLVATGMDNRILYVWDLRHLRMRLETEGLDWDWPEFAENANNKPPERIEVVAYGVAERLAADALTALDASDATTAADRIGKLRALDPDDPVIALRLAQFLLWGPQASFDARAAVKHARRAVDRRADWAYAHAVLGVAYSHTGEDRRAIASIEQGLKLDPRVGLVNVWYALAKCRLMTGDVTGASDAALKGLAAWFQQVGRVLNVVNRSPLKK